MGSWGPGIFSDDLACDLREEFRELIAEGHSPEEATTKLRGEYTPDDDLGDRTTFYLALAAVQWKAGRLLDDIRDEALRIIDSGEAIEDWKAALFDPADNRSIKRREAAINKLREQLLQPPPAPKRIRKRFKTDTDWKIGYGVEYRLRSGRYIVFRVIGIHEDQGGRSAVVDIADWVGDAPAERSAIDGLPRLHTVQCLKDPDGRPTDWDGKLALYEHRAGVIPLDRLRVIATDLRVRANRTGGCYFFGGWAELDEYLEEEFNLT